VAKKGSEVKDHAPIAFKDIVWLVNNLSREQLAEVDKTEVSLSDVNVFMSEEIENGAKISFKFDDYSSCAQVSMIYIDAGYENSGFALSARGADFHHCMCILMYKFHVVCEGALSEAGQYAVDRPKYG